MTEASLSMGEVTRHIIQESDVLYEFTLKFAASMNVAKDYGTGDKLNMVEVHLLTYIEEHPRITGSELAKLWNRTKGAISQQVKKLVDRGFVVREKQPGNAKSILLNVTEKGRGVSLAHKMHDYEETAGILRTLLKTCTLDEVLTFYKVVGAYVDILDKK